ncbi:MAG: hypothetical protein J5699_05240 [Bacteroidales bacterium]|nr:hypothetical protein [Bacteroidales bacterium]
MSSYSYEAPKTDVIRLGEQARICAESNANEPFGIKPGGSFDLMKPFSNQF